MLDAGDIFSGTLFFTKYEGLGGQKVMNHLGYQAMTIGNHEFDKGPQGLANFVKGTEFPVISANLDFSAESRFDGLANAAIGENLDDFSGKVFPAVIMEVNGEKVGILGLTTPETEFISSPGENIKFNDYITSAQETVKQLEEKGINKIIALSHLGFDDDEKLAAAVESIDLIVGGHSHTKLDQAVKVDHENSVTYIVQANEWGKFFGRADITFDGDGVVTAIDSKLLETNAKDADGNYLVAEDTETKALTDELAAPIEEMKSTVVGNSAVALDGEREHVRGGETNLGNLIADGMLDKAAGLVDAQIAITNGGGIRASIDAGEITLGEVLTTMPFGNTLVTLELTGEQIIAALENGVSEVEKKQGKFPHVAGLKFKYDSSKPAGERIVSVVVKQGIDYQPIDTNANYVVATNNFMADGGDFYSMFKDAKNAEKMTELYFVDYEVFTDYLTKLGTVSPKVEDRIIDVAGQSSTTVPPTEQPQIEEKKTEQVKDQVYVVKSGDVLWKIAKKYGMDWKELAKYNNLKNPHLILVGQQLLIPVKN